MKKKSIILVAISLVFIGALVILIVVKASSKTDNLEYKCRHSYGCVTSLFGKSICAYKNQDYISEDIVCPTDIVKNEQAVVNIYVFHGDGCPHCTDLINFLDELEADSNYGYKINIKYYEVWKNASNASKMRKALEHFDLDTTSLGVPFYVIGNKYKSGFANPKYMDETQKKEQSDSIKELIDNAYYNGYTDIGNILDK